MQINLKKTVLSLLGAGLLAGLHAPTVNALVEVDGSDALALNTFALRQDEEETNAAEEQDDYDDEEDEEEYCEWVCPEPAEGEEIQIVEPSEEAGCTCEPPDLTPKADRIFDMIDAFLGGFRSDESFPNAAPCSEYLRDTVNEFNETSIMWKEMREEMNYTKGQMVEDYIFDTTHWISYSIAPASRYCYSIGLDGWAYVRTKIDQFEAFADVGLAWLQSMLGNSITFQALITKISKAMKEGDMRQVCWWYGRMFTLLIHFEPIPDSDFEEYETGMDSIPKHGESVDIKLLASSSAALGSGAVIHAPSRQTRGRTARLNAANLRQDENESPDFEIPADMGEVDQEPATNSTEHKKKKGELFAKSMYKFSIGFVASLFGDNAPNTLSCTSNFTRIANASIALVHDFKNATNETLAQSAIDFENILASVDPIINGCYESAFEFKDTTLLYVKSFADWQNLLLSLVHKTGYVYDIVEFLVKAHKGKKSLETDEEKIEWWYKLGIYYGLILYNVLYHGPPEMYSEDPADAFPSYDSFLANTGI